MLLHEFGHLFALFFMKKRVLEIRLDLFGAVIRAETLTRRQELLCTLSGPLVNLISAVFLFFCAKSAAYISTALFLFNMLPIYPLDGGRILCCILENRLHPTAAQRAVHIASLLVSLFIMLTVVSICAAARTGFYMIFFAALVLLRLGKAAELEGY